MLVIAAVLSVAGSTPDTSTNVRSRTYLENFKDLALSSCIATAYKTSPDATTDASASAGGYFEFTRYDLDRATDGLKALIDATLAQRYSSYQGPSIRLDLMKCLDMYHGDALATLARRVVERPSRSYAQDNPEDK